MRDNKTAYTENQIPEISVTYSCTIPPQNRTKIGNSYDAVEVFRQLWDDGTIEYREQFYVLYLNRSNHVLGYFLHSIGGLSSTTMDIKQILGVALKANAASIILSHNHPSGNTRPSRADELLTQKMVNGASYLDIVVLDNIILTTQSFYSFADEGALPTSGTKPFNTVTEYYGLYPIMWDT